MSQISRRRFIKAASSSAVVGTVIVKGGRMLRADPLGLPLGCQTWPVREMIAKDFPGTLKELSATGFQTVELCSPLGYADSGFGGLAKYKGSELRSILQDAGLTSISSHFSLDELRKNQDDRISWAKEVGLTQMLVASLNGPKNPTMDDVKRAADEYNKIAAEASTADIQQFLHDEEFEMATIEGDGRLVYTVLLDLLDPGLVKMQFQMSAMTTIGDPIKYFNEYPGRFTSMHVQGVDPDDSNSVWRLAVGQDRLNWAEIFKAAKAGGLKNYFVELNWDLTKKSVAYLKTLNA